ncbi:hypothetical protein REPUB_Repub14bG0067300 [Reevesia pubescens]
MEERLRAAAQSGSIDQLYELIREDGNVLRRVDQDEYSANPLHIAAAAEYTDFEMEIMNFKPSFARKLNQDGFTPIHLALQNRQGEIVFHMLSIDKDLDCLKDVTTRNETSLHIFAQYNRLEVLEILVRWLLRAKNNWEKYLE